MTRRHIAVLWHERDRGRDLGEYTITHLADCWRNDGHQVRFVFGVDRFEAADVVIVHVDVSVIPARYLDFAAHYPMAVNGRVQDTRRTTFSRILVRRDDPYAGPVIVKSNATHAGAADRSRAGLSVAALRWRVRRRVVALLPASADAPPMFSSPLDYRVFDRAADVPDAWFSRPELVVERFLPEREGDAYAVRRYEFLGDRFSCTRMIASQPIVNGSTQCAMQPVELDPAIERLRQQLGFEYGTFDYALHQGRPVLLDLSKTPRGCAPAGGPEPAALWRHRAEGIHSFFG